MKTDRRRQRQRRWRRQRLQLFDNNNSNNNNNIIVDQRPCPSPIAVESKSNLIKWTLLNFIFIVFSLGVSVSTAVHQLLLLLHYFVYLSSCPFSWLLGHTNERCSGRHRYRFNKSSTRGLLTFNRATNNSKRDVIHLFLLNKSKGDGEEEDHQHVIRRWVWRHSFITTQQVCE